ncbi:MAG: DUF4270 family protein [Bacteroidota bacterium]
MQRLAAFLLILMSIMACSLQSGDIPTLEVGQDFVDSDVRIIVLDTFDLQLSTFKFDSINTSASNRLLFGRFNDTYFGKVEASSYLELVAPVAESVTGPFDISTDAELDSVALILGYDAYFYQDTTKTLQINVHQLLEEVIPDEDVFYNTSTLKFDSIPITSKTFLPEPFDEDSVHVSIPFEFGREIFSKIQEDEINDNEDLRDNLFGFALVSNTNDDGSIIGFSKNEADTYLRFFYSIPGELEDEEEVLDLVINPSSISPVAFHTIKTETTDTDLIELTDQEVELRSKAADNLSFLQSGTGFATKITFPNIKTLFDIPGTGTILSAVLQIKPLSSSVTDLTPIRDTLNIAVLDVNNIITQEIRIGTGPVQGVIVGEDEEFGTVLYEIPIGIFLDEKLSEQPETESALVVFQQSFNETVNGIVLQGEEHPDFRARIIITYAIYDE